MMSQTLLLLMVIFMSGANLDVLHFLMLLGEILMRIGIRQCALVFGSIGRSLALTLELLQLLFGLPSQMLIFN